MKDEYVDLLCSGIDQKLFEKSGFKVVIKNEDVIVPTYFEPFVDKNIDIHCPTAYKELGTVVDILNLRKDLVIKEIRGNIQTRINFERC